mmetsp:Transcript_1560/g.3333  ORF Transcript_1560/g.3333 Transcript_1560/m.3333 type:complete len:449 (+) Transcript_1560:83-1429(+)
MAPFVILFNSLLSFSSLQSHRIGRSVLTRNNGPLHALESRFDEMKDETEQLLRALRQNDLREQLVELPIMFTGEKEGLTFDIERWNMHRSSSRYIRLLFGVLFSVTTTRILPPVLMLVAWSGGVDLYNSVEHLFNLPEVELPLTPFELTAPMLGLLLVFRSDRAFDRFNLGSDYSWEITSQFKTIVRELFSFTAAQRFWPEERAAAYDLVEACVQLHGWIMMDHLRGKQISTKKQEKFLRLTLGSQKTNSDFANSEKMEQLMSTPLTPAVGVAAISLGMMRRLPSFDFQESTLIESQFGEIICALSKCEMMLRTPIPLGYTRYSVRFLWIWLSLLPFALVNKFAEFGIDTWWEDKPQPVLIFAMLFIGFIFFSIEDMSVQIEEPFSVLPLELHQKWLIQYAKQIETMNQLSDGLNEEQSINGTTEKQTTNSARISQNITVRAGEAMSD